MPSVLENLVRPRNRAPARQRDPAGRRRSLAWLIPAGALLALGAWLFYVTSPKKVGEPFEAPFAASDIAFRESMSALLGAPFVDGNRAEALVNGDEIFPAMLDAIRAARRSITLETYIWTSGKLSDQFIEALNERARAGVKVHALADGFGAIKLKDEDIARMKDAGVSYVRYDREQWYDPKPNINHRTHRKLLIVDGRIGFTGGVCIADEWLGDAESSEVWRDTHVRIEGPAVAQMQAVFAVNWLQTTSELLIGEDYFPPLAPVGDALVQTVKSGPQEDPEHARISYLLAIAAARRSIKLAHAYFVPDDVAIEMLIAARQRGVDVQVIVPLKNDSRVGRAASRSRWGKLLAAGVKFHQYEPALYHCKVMIVDDVFVSVGSVNFDNRSFAINDEVNVNLLDAAEAREHVRIFEEDLRQSRPLSLEQFRERSVFVKLWDHLCGILRTQL